MKKEVTEPTEGQKAPDFKLSSSDGKIVSLGDFLGKQVVLYFYPKDMTPGCTAEACSFRDNISKIEGKNAIVLGVSLDGEDSHRQFLEKYGLPFLLLSDEKGEVSKRYGVYKQKNLYGKKFWGIERSTFIIDQKGVIKKVFRKVKVDGHTKEVLAALS